MNTKALVIGVGLAGAAALLWSKIGSAATPATPATPTDGATFRAPVAGPADAAVLKAFTMHAIGHGGNNVRPGMGDEGQAWADTAKATPGVTLAQLQSLTAMGYT